MSLHDAVLATWESGRAQCGGLLIEIRLRGEDSSTYMFSVKGRQVAQANLRNESVRKLKRLPEEFSVLLDADGEWPELPKERTGAESVIGDLRFGLRDVSFKAHVTKKSDVRAVTTRDGTPLLVCQVTLSDGTGEIPLAIWNNQIPTISNGDLVQIQNARVRSFRGQIQLALNRKTGILTVLKPANKQPINNQLTQPILVENRA